MRHLLHNTKSKFCISNILDLRENFKPKMCFKKKYQFLKLKHTPTYSLSNRLQKKGNHLKMYKPLKAYYYNYILFKKFKFIPSTCNFLFFFNKSYTFRDFDRVLM